jgi:hypothetical protein
MMAVDSTNKGGSNVAAQGTPSAGTPSAAQTLAGMPAVSANGKKPTRKRPSSLLAAAQSLPSVENSLDEFIARANETLVDSAAFNTHKQVEEEDKKRKEQDALRMKATEQQMRESQAREESLRRQLDGLQGKLAEAEARAAVASAGGSQDGVIADLKLRLTMADDRARSVEEKARGEAERVAKLSRELESAKAEAAAVAAAPPPVSSALSLDQEELEQRLRIAETKAVKAITAAKAASMGLTVNPADIAAIESGLVVPMDAGKKGTNWGLVIVALIVGGALAFAGAFVLLKKDTPKAAAGAAPAVEQTQPQAAPPAPVKPTVTPIEEPAPAAAAPAAAAPAAEAPAAAAVEAPPAAAVPAAAAPEAAPVVEAPKAEPKAVEKKAAPAKKATVKKAPKAEKKASGGGLADPFGGDSPAPKKAPKAEKKPAGGGIVDPF